MHLPIMLLLLINYPPPSIYDFTAHNIAPLFLLMAGIIAGYFVSFRRDIRIARYACDIWVVDVSDLKNIQIGFHIL